MAKRVYLDSNVFISWFNEEIGFGQRPLFLEARDFFEKVAKQNCKLILSDLFFYEVKNSIFCSRKDALGALSSLVTKIECLERGYNLDTSEFVDIGIHFSDSLHIAVALRAKCDCIVTFNTKDFFPASNRISVVSPADF